LKLAAAMIHKIKRNAAGNREKNVYLLSTTSFVKMSKLNSDVFDRY